MAAPKAPKIALVTDWLTTMGGAEPLLLEIHKLFPKAPIYTSVYDKKNMPAFQNIDVRPHEGMEKRLPKSLKYKHVLWPTIRARAFRHIDLSDYDIIFSTSSAEAKAVKKTRPGQIHIAYIHTPIRYYWSHYNEFRKEFSFGKLTPLIRPLIPLLVKKQRRLDYESAQDIDVMIANSTVTQQRIKDYYGKTSTIIHPPVDVAKFTPPPKGERHGFVVWGRHVPYKRFDLAIQAANKLGVNLTIAGSGPDTERLKSLAGPTIKFVGRISDDELIELAHHSEAFLFPNEEDFGIAAVEALAAGTPVIAYKKGGALDIVQEGETGVFFEQPTVESLTAAMKHFTALKRNNPQAFLPATLHRKAKRFDKGLFATKIRKIVLDNLPIKQQS